MAEVATTASVIQFDPLRDNINTTALQLMMQLVKTTIGPHGKLKILQNITGGHVTITSSSSRLVRNISVKNAFLKIIVNSIKSHLNSYGDGGLFSMLLILKLINNSLQFSYPLCLVGSLYEYFGRVYLECLKLESNLCVISVDFSNLKSLQSVVYSILRSKPGCLLSVDDQQHLLLLLLKAFLNAVPHADLGKGSVNIRLLTSEGLSTSHSRLFEGLLMKRSYFYNTNQPNNQFPDHQLKVALFITSLSGDAEFPVKTITVSGNVSVWEAVLKILQDIVNKLISKKVNVVACQKVIHPKLKKQLRDANIIVLDRLGIEATKYLQFISGAPAVTSLTSDIDFGVLTKLEEIIVAKKPYFLFHNIEKPFWSMLIFNHNEQAVSETKVVCQQVVSTLLRLLSRRKFCYGAGCTEIYTLKLFEKQVQKDLNKIKDEIGCTSSQVLEVLHCFLQSIRDVIFAVHQASCLDFVTDTTRGHLWRIRDGNFPTESHKCMCGRHLAKSTEPSSWTFFTKHMNDLSDVPDRKSDIGFERFRYSCAILDDFHCKINAFLIAFETSALLLKTSLCISNSL